MMVQQFHIHEIMVLLTCTTSADVTGRFNFATLSRFGHRSKLQRAGVSGRCGWLPGGRGLSEARVCRHHQRTCITNAQILQQDRWKTPCPLDLHRVSPCFCKLGWLIQLNQRRFAFIKQTACWIFKLLNTFKKRCFSLHSLFSWLE